MNKKTIAITAAALLATSGLAFARPVHSQAQARAYQEQVAPEGTVVFAPFRGALNTVDNGYGETRRYPGDNDMDPYARDNR